MSQVFAFQSSQVRTFTENGETWFSVVDVCRVLSISYHGKTLARFPSEWKRVHDRLMFISEAAVYRLVFRSKNPEATAFANHVASTILPAVRKGSNPTATPKAEPAPKPALPPARSEKDAARDHWIAAHRDFYSCQNAVSQPRTAFDGETRALKRHYGYTTPENTALEVIEYLLALRVYLDAAITSATSVAKNLTKEG